MTLLNEVDSSRSSWTSAASPRLDTQRARRHAGTFVDGRGRASLSPRAAPVGDAFDGGENRNVADATGVDTDAPARGAAELERARAQCKAAERRAASLGLALSDAEAAAARARAEAEEALRESEERLASVSVPRGWKRSVRCLHATAMVRPMGLAWLWIYTPSPPWRFLTVLAVAGRIEFHARLDDLLRSWIRTPVGVDRSRKRSRLACLSYSIRPRPVPS